MVDLFVGVVSHRQSRFADAQDHYGIAAQLQRELTGLGLTVEVAVNTADLHDPISLPVSAKVGRDSLSEQLRLALVWSRFLGQQRGPVWWTTYALRWVKRATAFARDDTRVVTRLLNIELSHLDLMHRGLASGASWVLVLEDDAASRDAVDCAAGLRGLMQDPRRPAFVNVSQSFPLYRLGLDHLLSPAAEVTWHGRVHRQVLAADRPVTNTVCAILYERGFLASLVEALDALPMTPVVPIDWKLNMALMRLHAAGMVPPGACWLVEPAPIMQRSMTSSPAPG